MKLNGLSIASFFLSALTLSPAVAQACTCVILNDTCRPLSTAAVILEATIESVQFVSSSTVERSIVTGQDGRYVVSDLQPGRYWIVATPPPGAPQLLMDSSIEVAIGSEPAKACSENELIFSIASEIAGIVTDENGVPQRGVFLSLRLADQRDLSRGAAGLGYTTGADGRYRFNNLPPGRYQVFLNPETLPGSTEAPVIELALGEKITLAPVRIRK